MILPNYLETGDKVAIVAPAGRLNAGDLDQPVEILKTWGLEARISHHAFDGDNFFSATDRARLQDMQSAIDDPEIRAIFCARGGYGTGRILDALNWDMMLKSPKWLIGFSDISLLHLQLFSIGVLSVHGMVARQIKHDGDEQSFNLLHRLLFGGREEYRFSNPVKNIPGVANERIVGGNLSMICNSIGSSTHIDWAGKILFIEDVNEYYYAIDRNLNHLHRAGILGQLSGLVVGKFTGMKDTTPTYGKSVTDIVKDYTKSFGYPVAADFDAGHGRVNLPFIHGARHKLEVKELSATLICIE